MHACICMCVVVWYILYCSPRLFDADDVADAQNAQYMGLRDGPCGYESASGDLCVVDGPLGTVVAGEKMNELASFPSPHHSMAAQQL